MLRPTDDSFPAIPSIFKAPWLLSIMPIMRSLFGGFGRKTKCSSCCHAPELPVGYYSPRLRSNKASCSTWPTQPPRPQLTTLLFWVILLCNLISYKRFVLFYPTLKYASNTLKRSNTLPFHPATRPLPQTKSHIIRRVSLHTMMSFMIEQFTSHSLSGGIHISRHYSASRSSIHSLMTLLP